MRSVPAAKNVKRSYTITEFCKAFGIGRTNYYERRAEGKTPKEIKMGARVIITMEAADAWRREMEGQPV